MIPHLAERVAGTLSFSVSHWREDGQVMAPPWAAVRLQLDCVSPASGDLGPLLCALADLLTTPYTTDQWPRSAAIVAAAPGDPADAMILLAEQWIEDQRHLVYEATFPHSEAVFRGSFSIG
jgi:hypothetical protein